MQKCVYPWVYLSFGWLDQSKTKRMGGTKEKMMKMTLSYESLSYYCVRQRVEDITY